MTHFKAIKKNVVPNMSFMDNITRKKNTSIGSLPEFPANILSMSAVWCQYLIMDLLQLAPAWIETVGKAHVSVQYFLGRVRAMCALLLLGLVGLVAELPALRAWGQPFSLCHMLNVIWIHDKSLISGTLKLHRKPHFSTVLHRTSYEVLSHIAIVKQQRKDLCDLERVIIK